MELIALFSTNQPLYVSCVAILGLLFGSFFNVVIHRLPKMLQNSWTEQCEELLEITDRSDLKEISLLSPSSRCPHCARNIGWIDNIPILSFVFLRGRCRYCKTKISMRYPVVETLTALTFSAVAWTFGFSYAALAGIVLSGMLIPLIFIDIDEQILPDSITLPGIWLGLLINSMGVFTDLYSAIYGAVAGYVSLWLVYHGFRLLTGKEGMGYGDFKLLAMLGAWLGWQQLPLIVLLSATVGAVTGIVLLALQNKTRDTPIPFGPYLCLAGWISLVAGNDIVNAYFRFTGLT